MCIENNLSIKKMLGLFNSTGQILKYYLQKLFTADKRIKKENSAASFFVFELEPPSGECTRDGLCENVPVALLSCLCLCLPKAGMGVLCADEGI